MRVSILARLARSRGLCRHAIHSASQKTSGQISPGTDDWTDERMRPATASRWRFAARLRATGARHALRFHWPEYVMEASEIGVYMVCVCAFASLLQHPASPVHHWVASGCSRRALMGMAVGATVIAIIQSPLGQQSGGHFNPAITFTFYRLGKVASWDALFYAAAQFLGATSGVAVAVYALRGAPRDRAVLYAATVPGAYGLAVAFAAEVAISFALMITILFAANRERLKRYAPYFVGALYAV